jgi:hypothetical protein
MAKKEIEEEERIPWCILWNNNAESENFESETSSNWSNCCRGRTF